MSKLLFERRKAQHDRVVRCYLTLNCSLNCWFCSAQVPQATMERRRVWLPAKEWAEGINARARPTLLAGGEPLLYPELAELLSLIKLNIKLEFYSNLVGDIKPLVAPGTRRLRILASLHPDSMSDSWSMEVWHDNVKAVTKAGHAVRFHVVKVGAWERAVEFLLDKGHRGPHEITGCDDQRSGAKSRGVPTNMEHPKVNCTTAAYLFGPDGFRYPCVHLMVLGCVTDRREHIMAVDGQDVIRTRCKEFGLCSGCDNNIEGTVEE